MKAVGLLLKSQFCGEVAVVHLLFVAPVQLIWLPLPAITRSMKPASF